ncbi:MAG: ADP-ribosylglycohydrolase family protein [Muribaculaceae bacterium]|nr:ADP-ribosylglycohydrolase family protein [Muribaculaceae bacterium]
MLTDKLQDKCRGSLVGGAVGDALGYPVEFDCSFKQIQSKYGEDGIKEYDLTYPWLDQKFDKALFSDDTQMTLYTAEGLLEAVRSGKDIVPTICNAYLAWYGHQVGKKVKISYQSELSKIEELNQRRAPGNTCINSLMLIHIGKDPENSSKGCGGIMRVAPIAIYGACHGWSLEKTALIAGESAELTHQHPLSTYASAALAVIVYQCLSADNVDSETFRSIVNATMVVTAQLYGDNAPGMNDFKKIIEKTMLLEHNPLPDWKIIENSLGGGWVAEETLAIAIFSVLRHIDDFNACMSSAVNHGGDSDSTGAVAGNIIGAILGYDAIPDKFKDTIQLKELLLSTADALFRN